MDYAELHLNLIEQGFQKINTQDFITNFKVNFKKESETITVHWLMGGYVKSISTVKEEFGCPIVFLDSFSNN